MAKKTKKSANAKLKEKLLEISLTAAANFIVGLLLHLVDKFVN